MSTKGGIEMPCCIRVGHYDKNWELHARACGTRATHRVDGYPVCAYHMGRLYDPRQSWDQWIIYSTHPDQHVIRFNQAKQPIVEVIGG